MKRVEIVSYAKRDITYCFAGDKVYSGRKDDSRLDAVLNDEIGTEKELSFRKEILSTEERLPLGCLVFVFDTTSLDHLMKNQKKTELLIRDQDGKAIWSSKEYPEEAFEEAEKEGRLEDYTGSFVEKEIVGSYQIYTMLNKKLASQINFWTLGAAVGLGLLLVFAGELLVSWYLKRLNHRLVMILDGMEQVMKGNLTQRLLVNEKGDELDMTSDRFNEMCRQLDLYIQKSYLAEIEQKNAEMQALQSQINPHFLYNTLEAIRMKAITNVNRRVKAVYGPEYGVYIKQSQSGGVCVTLEIRYEEGTINENSDAGGR